MKLFNQTQVITDKHKQINADIIRLTNVNKELASKRQELHMLVAEFEFTLAKQQIVWDKEKTDYIKQIEKLKGEVGLLEERKKQALLPLTEKKKELDKLEKDLIKERERLEEKEEKLYESIENLEERLSEVGEREQETDRLGKLQANAQKGIDMQKEQIKQQAEGINKAAKKTMEMLDKREEEILKREIKMGLKENFLVDKEKELAKIEKEFIERERLIKDKYETLQRAINYNKNICKE